MSMTRHIEVPPEAVDRVYAQSLFELAEAEGGREQLESVAAELEEIADLSRAHYELAELFGSRIIKAADKRRSIEVIFGGRVSDLILRFLLVLLRKERLDRALPIIAAFDEMIQARFGRVEIDLYTRHAIPGEQLDSIRQRLGRALRREPVLHAYIDESMIGGLRMQVGDKLIDASIATRLRRMRERLIEGGSNQIHARYDSIVEDDRP